MIICVHQMITAQIAILLVPAICASLGGKAIHDTGNNHRLLYIDNYSYMSICGHESRGSPNVTILLSAPNNETNRIRISKYNIMEEFDVRTHIENIVAVEIQAHPDPRKIHRFNPKKITIRYDDQFFKFHLNPQCLQNQNYWTSVDEVTIWSKKIDCQSSSVICDDNTDMLMADIGRKWIQCPVGSLPPVTSVLFKNGVKRYQIL